MKKLIIISILLVRTATLCAQQTDYNWRLGLSGGFSNYYGDLSPFRIHGLNDAGTAGQLFEYNPNYVERPSYRITLERRLSNTTGIMLNAGSYQFAGSDRYVNRSGNLQTDAPEFQRALNFNTTLRDVGLSLVFKTDNDRLFKKSAFFAPYFTVGAGWFSFDVAGDLRDDNGNFYDYSAGTPQLNGNYETDLSQIRTNENGYNPEGWYANLGLGLKFRLSRRLDLNIESIVHYTNIDFLDDVSGNYPATFDTPEQAFASQPAATGSGNLRGTTNHNDLYIYHGVTLKYNFGYREKSFNAPTVRNYGIGQYSVENGVYSVKSDSAKPPAADTATPQTQIEIPHTTLNVFNYAAVIQEDDSRFREQTNEHLFELRKLLEISETQSAYREESKELSALQNELIALDNQIEEWETDTLSDPAERRKMLKKLRSDRKEKQELSSQKQIVIDSLNTAVTEIRSRTIPVDSNAGSGTKVIIGADTQTYYLPGDMRPVKRATHDTVYLGKRDTSQRQTTYIKDIEESEHQQTERKETPEPTEVADEKINELQQQIDALKEELKATKTQPEKTQERAGEFKDEDIRELQIEIAELRATLNERDRQAESVHVSPAATPAPAPDLRAINANMAAQTAAISALSYALLRDSKTTDEEKQRIQDALNALDTISGNQDSVALVLDSLANEKSRRQPGETSKLTERKTDTVRIESFREEKVQVTDSALKALESRINVLSAQIEGTRQKPVDKQTQKDTVPGNIDELISRIDELNKKLEAEKLRKTPEPEAKQAETILRKSTIYFGLNSAALTPENEATINELIQLWEKNKDYVFELTSYADNTGRLSYNIKMCENRLQAVKRSILSKYKTGEHKPKINLIIGGTVVRSSQSTPKSEDRRVEIILKKDTQ